MIKSAIAVLTLLLLSGALTGAASPAPGDDAGQGTQARMAPQIPPSGNLKLPEGVSLERPLSEDHAVAIALWNNAALQADLAALAVARADLLDAGLLRNPTLQLLLPFGYTQFEMLLNLPGEVLWQRPKRVAAAKVEVDRVAQGLEQNGLDVVRDVRCAYYDLQLAADRVRLSQEAVKLRTEIAALTDKRLRAGDISELEANAARIEVSTAEEQLARNQSARMSAHARLRFLLGLESEQVNFEIAARDTSGAAASSVPVVPGIEDLFKDAFAHRPDLLAATLAIEAAAGRAKWERSRTFAFAELLSIKRGAGLDFSPRGGLLAELPVFHRNKGGITRADSEVERAGAQYLAVHHRIAQEVREARTQLLQANESLVHYRSRILPQAEEGVRLAGIAFQAGEESYLLVLEATRSVIDARMREVELVNEQRRALAQLERSIGRRRDAKF
jgi:cobalt-zinc-cadmium efflux system outer membrane protein